MSSGFRDISDCRFVVVAVLALAAGVVRMLLDLDSAETWVVLSKELVGVDLAARDMDVFDAGDWCRD